MKLKRAEPTILSLFEAIAKHDFEKAQQHLRWVEAIYRNSQTEFVRSYLNALQGLVGSLKRTAIKPFLIDVLAQDPKELQIFRQELLRQSKLSVRDSVDRGYFEAWADFLAFLVKQKLHENSRG